MCRTFTVQKADYEAVLSIRAELAHVGQERRRWKALLEQIRSLAAQGPDPVRRMQRLSEINHCALRARLQDPWYWFAWQQRITDEIADPSVREQLFAQIKELFEL